MMKNMKKIQVLALTTLICLNCNIVTMCEDLVVGARGAVLMSKDTGRILWGKNEDTPLAMASTTKIMTAIVVLENAELDELVSVSKNASNQPKVNMDLAEGEVWSVEDMLYGLMLASYNDIAVALAEHISGNVDEFCKMMTDKAHELGAESTVFSTPNGLDSAFEEYEHCATPSDMAIITAYALENEKFCEIIKTLQVTITEQNNKRQVTVNNLHGIIGLIRF